MSAFILSHDHVDFLITAMSEFGGAISEERATELGREMMYENERSVAARYPDDLDWLPGSLDRHHDYTFRAWEPDRDGLHITEVTAYNAAASWLYQSCEHEDCEESEVWKLVAAFRDHLAPKVLPKPLGMILGWDVDRPQPVTS